MKKRVCHLMKHRNNPSYVYGYESGTRCMYLFELDGSIFHNTIEHSTVSEGDPVIILH